MATVLSFLSNRPDFDEEATRIMGEAFDAACKGLTWSVKSSRSASSKRQRRASVIRFVCGMPDWPLSDTAGKRSRHSP